MSRERIIDGRGRIVWAENILGEHWDKLVASRERIIDGRECACRHWVLSRWYRV